MSRTKGSKRRTTLGLPPPPQGTGKGLHIYKPEQGQKILALVAETGKSFHEACREVGVNIRTAYAWLANDQGFARELALARNLMLEHWASEILEIGDDSATPGRSMAQVTAARLQVDSRKWLLSKLHPQRYGDHLQVTGKDGAALIPANNEASAVPRLMQVLAVILPGTDNTQLMSLAVTMAAKLSASKEEDEAKTINGRH